MEIARAKLRADLFIAMEMTYTVAVVDEYMVHATSATTLKVASLLALGGKVPCRGLSLIIEENKLLPIISHASTSESVVECKLNEAVLSFVRSAII